MNHLWVRLGAVVTVLLVLGWIVLWSWSGQAEGGERTEQSNRSIEQRPEGGSEAERPPSRPEASATSEPHRTPTPEASVPEATLRIQVRREDGKPASGIVTWAASKSPPLTGSMLPVFSSAKGEECNGVHQAAYEDTATLQVPPDRWIWARVSAGKSPSAGWYLRVTPFRGERVETVWLSSQKRTLHIFALNPDLTGPAAREEVSVYSIDMRSGGSPMLLKKVETDEDGYARVGGLDPGGFLVCGPGGGLTDRHPHCARVMLPPMVPMPEMPCTVVAMERRRSVTLQIEADLQAPKTAELSPKLYLKRKDDGSGHPYPVPSVLRSGRQTAVVKVPPGTYELGALPLGRLVLECAEGFLEVEEDKDRVFAVKVRENDVETSLELRGIPQGHFPVTVHPRRCEDLVDEDAKLFFLGRYRWQMPTQQVPALDFRCRLVVLGKGGTYISYRELQLRPGDVAVDMKPACTTYVRWIGPEATRHKEAIVITSVGSDSVMTRLRPDMVRDGAELRPALVGMVVMPKGRLQIECRLFDGSLAWRREHDARGPSLVVSVKAE